MTLLFLSKQSGRASCLTSLQNKNILCAYRAFTDYKSRQESVQQRGKKRLILPSYRLKKLLISDKLVWRSWAETNARNLHLSGQVGLASLQPEQSEATQAVLLSGSGVLLQDIQVLALLAKLLQRQEHSIPHPCAYTASDTNVPLTGSEVRTCHPD